ncbi:adenosylcobinamide-phosphate synthase [Anoxybacillus mongoliensis]|uniref:Cobalamin biosynthesis protein CobD n=1 Tax=Anoxybacillus mongoliensis TaxID=452565 RepID=A0A7W8JFN9_9BACL|nr:adenosylcobinamide-phosphate synthase CbiB [Anoxybacillus mongoliensis]MBB5355748.1 adenosylcobinamide-phosphate synthase [Anoxybacillus mongoliensis]MCX8001310.1 adenosylcobinamide-phosphate synthase CbiB [Anoxybacillus mongoliensis]
MTHVWAIVFALLLDRIFADPHRFHPVSWIGQVIAYMDRRLNKGKGRKGKGLLTLFVVCTLTFVVSYGVITVAYRLSFLVGMFIEAIIIFVSIAPTSLAKAAYGVLEPLKRGDIEEARKNVAMIVGRDTEMLQEDGIVRACVETVAENTSDGVTAPLFYAFLGGGALAMLYRAVNTCDSMLGYKNDRYAQFGWASARLDDVLNYLPARLTAFVMLFVHRANKQAWKLLFRDARNHPSPNSGWCEAAMAALLGVQLGGVNTYKGVVSVRPTIGDASVPLASAHIEQAVAIMKRTTVAFTIGGSLFVFACTWS